jgi:hypothetical protein
VKPLLKLAINIARSVMFLTSYIMLANLGQDFVRLPGLRSLCHKDGLLAVPTRQLILNSIATLGIAFEQPHRRVDITYYCMPRSIEIVWNLLKNRKLIKNDFPFQNSFLVAISFAIIAYKYSEELEEK